MSTSLPSVNPSALAAVQPLSLPSRSASATGSRCAEEVCDVYHQGVSGYLDLIAKTTDRLRDDVGSISGVQVEPKRASVAVHYRLVAAEDRDRVAESVRALLDERPDELALVLHLIDVRGLGGDDVVPLYLGDDITDEDAIRVLRDVGIGIFVGQAEDPEVDDRGDRRAVRARFDGRSAML